MDLSSLTQLGVAGFALLIMWWKDQASVKERAAFMEQITTREVAFRKLEEEVRSNISAQLAASTSALQENAKIRERVISGMTGQRFRK